MTATLITLLVIGFQGAPSKPVLIGDLAKYDKQTVTVVGKVDKYQERVAKSSQKPYTVFDLNDGKHNVHVYLKGRPGTKVKNGDKVKVTGVYTKEKTVGSQTFKNEIDASSDKVKTNGVKPVK